ncbi:MAG: Gfo/Idh/MocA family oxidoreductase, partial [Sedimentisphaerales bacterium]|nr:Gfo/Idh/MocA family oxidoreductase [Sedimentisphaerales bacterium]
MHKERVSINRRRFLKTTAQAGVCLAIPEFIPGTALGKSGGVAPSERIILGAIGIGNRGRYVLGCFLREPDLRCIAVCDVRGDNRKRAKDQVDAINGDKDSATYIDMRELLARDDIDAVLIATGPNWHATAATMAAKAGKDVYCEKPCTKNIAQSLQLADVFR